MCENNCCFTKTLKLIDVLQRSSEQDECFDNTCSRPFLGVNIPSLCFNTRPITFYGCNNNLITVNYTTVVNGETLTGESSIFRVEKVDDGCLTVSVLIPNPDTADTLRPYITTNNTATINLSCVCVLKCLPDTIVDL
ncbi:MAG: hypothetical protein IJO43_01510 [Bacilli bacterium]|nr:hypothetical protein [Bacilli bacterium]